MAEAPASNTAICYLRTSSKGQRDRDTIQMQRRICQGLLERHGLELLPYGPDGTGWVVDDGISGTLLSGRAFSMLIDDLRSGAVRPGYLVIYDVNRLARPDRYSKQKAKIIESQEDLGRILGAVMSSGVWVIDRDAKMDPRKGAFAYALTKGGDQYVTLRENTMNGKRGRLEGGESAMSGKLPYGYQRTSPDPVTKARGVEANPTEAENLKAILRWYIKGGETFSARQATEAGIPVPRAHVQRKAGPLTEWRPQSVRAIVERVQIYSLGIIQGTFDEKTYQVPVPKLIEATLAQAVETRRKLKTIKRRTPFLTTGYMKCVCGTQKSPSHIQNRNNSKVHHTKCARCKRSVRQVEFDLRLREAIDCRLVQNALHTRQQRETVDHQAQVREIDAKLVVVSTRAERLYNEYDAEQITRDVYRRRNALLTTERTDLEAERERILADEKAAKLRAIEEEDLAAKVSDLLRDRRDGDLDRQREILASILGQGERITVGWERDEKGRTYAVVTLPALGSLPPLTYRTGMAVAPQVWTDAERASPQWPAVLEALEVHELLPAFESLFLEAMPPEWGPAPKV
jgi:hypothetical protein